MILPTAEELAQEARPAIEHITSHLACFNCLPPTSATYVLDSSSLLGQYAILSTGLTKFQEQTELPQTGVFDIITAEYFNRLHCHNHTKTGEILRDANHQDGKEITYCFNKYSMELSVGYIREAFEEAFQLWEKNCPIPIKFVEVAPHPGKGDIRISWVNSSDREDNRPVSVIYPSRNDADEKAAIEMYIDEDKNMNLSWDLVSAVAHQVGHILGLGHSEELEAIMFPTYKYDVENLYINDIKAIWLKYPPPRKFEVRFDKSDQSGSIRRRWNLILDPSNTPDQITEIIAGPGGILYARDAGGDLWRHKALKSWEQIVPQPIGGTYPISIHSLTISSNYIYSIDADFRILRCSHDETYWEIVYRLNDTREIASSHDCTDLYRLSNDGEILVLEESDYETKSWKGLNLDINNTSITTMASKLYARRGRDGETFFEDRAGWTKICGSSTTDYQLVCDGNTVYRFEKYGVFEWKGGEEWAKLDGFRMRMLRLGRTISDFAAANKHRYVVKAGDFGQPRDNGILYNKKGNKLEELVEWEYLRTPTPVSKIAAIDDELYYLDNKGCIYHIFMG